MSDVEDFLATENLYQIKDCVDVCEKTYLNAINTSNVFKMIAVADQYDRQTTHTFSLDFLKIASTSFAISKLKVLLKFLGTMPFLSTLKKTCCHQVD